MQYKAHIPAGIALSATAMLVAGRPLDLLMLVGGAVGGALPDIDVSGDDGQGSAVQHLGKKANQTLSKTVVLSPLAKVFSPVTSVFDAVILSPLCRLWRFVAKHALAPAYKAVANSAFGMALGFDRGDPSVHRGGLTHSFFSMVLFSLPILPLCMLAGIPQLWEGIMWGMLSHLICDAFCKSGVKFFWPWVPPVGFKNEDGVGGREGVKLLPARALMKTGKCTSRAELRRHLGERKYGEYRKYYFLEKGWQVFFKVMAVLVPILVVTGLGPASGEVSFLGKTYDVAGKKAQATVRQESEMAIPVEDQVDSGNAADARVAQADANDPNVMSASNAAEIDAGRNVRVDEHKGPFSLTYGDVAVDTLPAGVMKMPDESLWIAGVGPVNEETLADPNIMMTEEEKQRLLAAANSQRRNAQSSGLADTVENAKQGFTDAVDGLAEGVSGITSTGAGVTGDSGIIAPGTTDPNAGTSEGDNGSNGSGGSQVIGIPGYGLESDSPIDGFLDGLLGDPNSGGGLFGFHGLTPFTQPSS